MSIYHKILELIDRHDSFAISAHVNPDGDSIGAQLALYSFLADLNKYVRIFNSIQSTAWTIRRVSQTKQMVAEF